MWKCNCQEYSIPQTSDNGYIVVGDVFSNDGDVNGGPSDRDYWMAKLTECSFPVIRGLDSMVGRKVRRAKVNRPGFLRPRD